MFCAVFFREAFQDLENTEKGNAETEKLDDILLSIVVPAYNAAGFIERCLNSIASQSLRRIECVVVDDGSTDDTAGIAGKVMVRHPDIVWKLVRQENRGSSRARYAGVRAAGAEWIGFVDADDYVDRGYFEALYACAERTEADIIAGEYTQEGIQKRQTNRGRVHADGEVITPEEARMEVFNRTCVYSYSMNKIYRKDLLTSACFPEEKMIGEDFSMILAVLDRASSVAICRETGYHYATRMGSQTLRAYGETKRRGYYNYRRIYMNFSGTAEEKRALGRYIMLEYMSCMLQMYRSRIHDKKVEKGVLSFVHAHRRDYILHGKDSPTAKCFAAVLTPLTHMLFFRIWPVRHI